MNSLRVLKGIKVLKVLKVSKVLKVLKDAQFSLFTFPLNFTLPMQKQSVLLLRMEVRSNCLFGVSDLIC